MTLCILTHTVAEKSVAEPDPAPQLKVTGYLSGNPFGRTCFYIPRLSEA